MERKVDGKLLLRSRPGAAAIAIVFLLGCGLSYVLHSSSSDLEDFAPISSGNSSAKGLIDDADLRRLAYIGERRCARAAMTAQSVRKFVIDRTFRGNSPWINFPPPHVASSLRPEYFVYWKSNVRTVYDNLVQQVRPEIIVEVGTHLGFSTIYMAKLVQKLNLNTQILCVDDFRGILTLREPGDVSLDQINGDRLILYQFMQNVITAGVADSVIFLPHPTTMTLDVLCQWGIQADMVAIDASHDFHSVWDDINNGYKILRPGGVLFGRDIDQVEVRDAVELFAKIHGFTIVVDGEYWIIQ